MDSSTVSQCRSHTSMALVVTLDHLQGLGAVGERVARVIFRGVSRVSRVFEQSEEVSFIGEVTFQCSYLHNLHA